MFPHNPHKRGYRLIPYPEARRRGKKSLPPGDIPYRIGGVDTPSLFKYRGTMIIGGQGAGKSLTLMLMMLQAFIKDKTSLGVIHDPKMELHAFLRWAGIPKEQIALLHPYDTRTYWWDIQADCTDSETAAEIAAALCPKAADEKHPFFTNAARMLLRDVIRFFIFRSREEHHYSWKLKDVLLACKDKKLLEQMFLRYPTLSSSLEYLERDNNDVLTTLYSHIDQLNSIAELWSKRPKTRAISFRRWRQRGKHRILVLGNDPNRETQLQTLNAVMFQQISKALLDTTITKDRDTWLFLDEFHLMQPIQNMSSFINMARSSRICNVFATQDMNQFLEKYGEPTMHSILQGLASKVFLQCSGKGASRSSEEMGEEEKDQIGGGTDINSRGVGFHENFKIEKSRVVLPGEVYKLPFCSKQNGLPGYYLLPAIGDPYRYDMPFEEFRGVWPDKPIESDYEVEEDGTKFDLTPWTLEERQRILYGIKGEPPPPPPPAKTEGGETQLPSNVKTFTPRRRRKISA